MRLILLILSVLLFSCSPTIYIVRHGEKAGPGMGGSTDVPLSPAGEQRALDLKEAMKESISRRSFLPIPSEQKLLRNHGYFFGLTLKLQPATGQRFYCFVETKERMCGGGSFQYHR
jgi:hypothetical protein